MAVGKKIAIGGVGAFFGASFIPIPVVRELAQSVGVTIVALGVFTEVMESQKPCTCASTDNNVNNDISE